MTTNPWHPQLPNGEGAIYRRLGDALERDIASGTLQPGDRLPPQRLLADRLVLSVGTVTKAYVEAERRGLVTGHVGRGTYVVDRDARGLADGARERPIDLGVNVIPHHAAARWMPDSLSALRRRADLFDMLAYAPAAGHDGHRKAAARWLKELVGYECEWGRLAITTGAQQAMALAFAAVCRAGDVVLCEEATFYGMKSLAESASYRLRGVPMDAEGILPSALDDAARQSGSRALYVMPTVHNPTGRTMGRVRRDEIVRVARAHDLWIVEDDNYAQFAPGTERFAPRLAALAPERTFYTSGVSKALAPGLRTGFLVCPSDDRMDAVLKTMRAITYAPSALGPMIFVQWVEDGSAAKIARAISDEVEARFRVAEAKLARWLGPNPAVAPHLWLPMAELDAERVAGRALRLGVAVTPPSSSFPVGSPISGLRVCIGAPRTGSELTEGVALLASAIVGEASSPRVAAI